MGRVIRTKDGFSKDVYELDIDKNKLDVVSTMKYGRDLRNKILLQEDKIYIMGGSHFVCEVYNYIDRKWTTLKSYEKVVKDSLDSWACTGFINFPKIQAMDHDQNDYPSYYSNNDGYALNYYHDSIDDDNDLYDDMDIDMDSELSMSRNSFYH